MGDRTSLPAAAVSLLLAALGYAFTTLHTLRSAQHSALLERVGEQLKELYGPLLACITASKSSYDAMVRQFDGARTAEASRFAASFGRQYDGATSMQTPLRGQLPEARTAAQFSAEVRRDPRGAEAVAYRAWVKEVLTPLNQKACELIISRADLLEGESMDPLLLQFVAHVSAYRVILQRWKEGNESEHSVIKYPDEIHAWVQEQFVTIKRRQAQLLGISQNSSSPLKFLLRARL